MASLTPECRGVDSGGASPLLGMKRANRLSSGGAADDNCTMDRLARRSRQGSAMRATRLVAGAAVIGGVWLNFVGLDQVVVAADASPIVVATEQDPSGPTFTVEPAPSAPSPDIVGDSGIVSSTDSGSAIPGGSLPEVSVGGPSELAPVLDVPSGSPPIEVAAGPTVSPAPNDAPGSSPNPVPGDPDGPPAGPEHALPPDLVSAPA